MATGAWSHQDLDMPEQATEQQIQMRGKDPTDLPLKFLRYKTKAVE